MCSRTTTPQIAIKLLNPLRKIALDGGSSKLRISLQKLPWRCRGAQHFLRRASSAARSAGAIWCFAYPDRVNDEKR